MTLEDRVVAGVLVEREGEIDALAAPLAAARAGHGAFAVIEGPAGIGKTRLIAAAREAALVHEMTVLTARASDLEREFEWGVVRQLLEPALAGCSQAERADALAGVAALAAPLLAPAAAPGTGPEEHALMHGLYWLCANLSRRRPLLLAVDDAHWSDLPSLRFITYLARRIDGMQIALVVASRPGESRHEEDLLAGVAAEPLATLLCPEPLTHDAVAGVLGLRLGADPGSKLVAACHEATRGNPFLIEELARALRGREIEPVDVADVGPRSVARAITRRLRALAPGGVEVARAAAVLGTDADLRRVAALAEINPEEAAAAVDALVAAEILLASRPLDFIHPLVRSAIHGDIPPARRAALHRRAALLLSAEASKPARVAAHLLATDPAGDAWTVESLRAAAREAMGRGAAPAAITYLERALAEPPEAAGRAAVLRELGRAEGADARVAASEGHLRRAAELARTPGERAAAMLDLARTVSMADWTRAGFVYLEALEELPAGEPLALTLEAELITVALNVFTLREAALPIVRRRLRQLAAGDVDDPLLLGALGLALASSVPPAAQGAAVARRASDLGFIDYNTNLPGCVGNALLFAGELAASASYYADVAEEAGRRGWANGVWAYSGGARPSLQLGEVRRAEEDARFAVDTVEEQSRGLGGVQRGYLLGHLGEILLERGAVDEVDALVSRHPVSDTRAATYGDALVLCVRSALRLAQGKPAEALADALAVPPVGVKDWNPAVGPWRSHAALAHAALGNHEEARDLAASELERARAFGAPHAIGRALRTSARCAADAGAAIGLLEEAIEVVEPTDARLELVHAVVELGAALRRAGKRGDAVERLRAGLDLAHRCGAAALAEHARAELLLAGARPRRPVISGVDSLTAAERRVAKMAADGMTNHEIAQALFVTSRTVEGHLTHVYQKLAIGSRRELAGALRVDAVG